MKYVSAALLILVWSGVSGCAVGTTPPDESGRVRVVVGFETGTIESGDPVPETPGEAVAMAGSSIAKDLAKYTTLLPPPWNMLASNGLTLTSGGLATLALSMRRRKKDEDKAYDEGRSEGLAVKEAADKAWDEAMLTAKASAA